MGEAVAAMSEEAVNLEMKDLEAEAEGEIEVETDKSKKMKREDGSAAVVRWERFLPRMVLRVLLVEADDSTRQIIAALLRKCSYKVAAVSDGLKAWELLKGKPHCIDLILTEVDLPSISGFALLTLIMEHETCKNIPVIMMSTHDSVSVVYKCMLRGAADFLVKPVRKNELKNLWQHVWRRQASASGRSSPQDESDGQQKVEATAENNATSNPSSGFMTCIQRNRECIEKGSDAQSSCTKPDLEGERAITENMKDLNPMNGQKHEGCVKSSRKSLTRDCENRGSVVAVSKDADESERENANVIAEASDDNHGVVVVNSSTEAIDLIGAFDNYPKYSYRSSGSNDGTNKVDSSLLLDLSLRRSNPSCSVNQVSNERHALNHSDASAFSRYINRAPIHSSPSVCNQQKDCGTDSDRQLSSHTLNITHSLPLSSQKNMLSQATGQSGKAQQSVISVPIPVRGTRLDSLSTAYGSVMPPMFSTQSGVSPAQSPGSAHHRDPSSQMNSFHSSILETRNPQQLHKFSDQNANNSTNQTDYNQRHKLESSDEQRYLSPATDQSASSSFCNGTLSRLNSIGRGSNGNVDHVLVVRAAAENGSEGGFSVLDRNCQRSVQREAALNKFRLKRKDRCYEKKVRYESRKKLAEQRPRVKGQFVRNAQAEMASLETDNHPRG